MKAVTGGGVYRLSEAFLSWREKFLVYGDYCANLTAAQARISDITTRNDAVHAELVVKFFI